MSSKYFKSDKCCWMEVKPATLAVEEGTIRQILDYSPNSDDGHVVDLVKNCSSWASGYTCSYKRTWQN